MKNYTPPTPGRTGVRARAAARLAQGLPLSLALTATLLWAGPALAKFDKIGDLDTVSVSHDANFQTVEGQGLLRTWILLEFKEDQRFDPGLASLQPGNPLSYKSRKDYVQVDCKKNLYAELATQMFAEAEGKGAPVFENSGLRSAMPRFVNPSNHEGAVLVFLCKGIKPN